MAASANADALFVCIPLGDKKRGALRNVDDLTSTAVFDIQVTELLSIAGAAAVIGREHEISVLGQIQRPGIPAERVLSFRPAMDPEHCRICCSGV